MQIKCIQPMIDDPFHHLPDEFQQPNAVVVPHALWNQDDYYPKELARDLVQAAWANWTKMLQWSPLPGPPPSRSGSSSWRMPRSHSLMCSAYIPEAPATRPLDSSLAAVCSSPSDGKSSLISILSTLIGRESPCDNLLTYKSTLSEVWCSIVWKHGFACVSEVARYHPFRWRKAS